MALDSSIFARLGVYNGRWNPPITNPGLGLGTPGNDDILITNFVAGLAVEGEGGNDRITIRGGSTLLTTVNGGDGSDQIYGGSGIEALYGGAGNDYIDAGNGTDIISGGAGIDTLSFASFTGSPIKLDMTQLNALGNLNVQTVNGNGQWVSNGDTISNDFENIVGTNTENGQRDGTGDIITGNAGNNVIYGLDGNDILYGGGGDDVLVAGNGGGAMYGGDGNDTLVLGHLTPPTTDTSLVVDGGTGNNTLDLSGFEDVQVFLNEGRGQVADIPDPTFLSINNVQNVIGSMFADHIVGDDNNNVITGGVGFDDLTGGLGADTFRYLATTDSTTLSGTGGNGPDTIEDFSERDGDRIDLSAIDANANTPNVNDAFTFIGTRAFDGTAGELRFDSSNNTIDADTNGDKVADLTINFENGAPTNARDFIV